MPYLWKKSNLDHFKDCQTYGRTYKAYFSDVKSYEKLPWVILGNTNDMKN